MKAGGTVRPEWPGEAAAIAAVIKAAFAAAPHSGGNEAEIVEALRATGDLSLSLIATDAARIIAHAAWSPITVSDGTQGWFGLGPVAVLPECQGLGIGAKLIRHGISLLGERGARGVVVFGNPAYYGRFGFAARPDLVYLGAPPGFFQALTLSGKDPVGEVSYAAAFS